MTDEILKMKCDMIAIAIVKDFLDRISPYVNEWTDSHSFKGNGEDDAAINDYSNLIYKILKDK